MNLYICIVVNMFNIRPYFSLREEGYVFMLIVTYGYVLFMLIVTYGYVLLIINIDDEYDY